MGKVIRDIVISDLTDLVSSHNKVTDHFTKGSAVVLIQVAETKHLILHLAGNSYGR